MSNLSRDVSKDGYAETKAQPSVDESQDWELVSGYENGTHTVLRFNRKLTTCDDKDRVINGDTLRVIWAWNDQDPEDESGANGPTYHGVNRGTRSTVFLSNDVPEPPSTETTYTFDIVMNNVPIPPIPTRYWCRSFELPKLTTKHHVIKYEPVITPGNEGLVHHLIIYNCKKDKNITILPADHPGHRCGSPNMPEDWDNYEIENIVVVWAVGGGNIIFPENTGYSIGDDDDSGCVMLEMHYDNQQLASGKHDSSGIRMTYTPELRDNDIGVLTVGMRFNKNHAIPPHAEGFTSAAFCTPACLDAFIAEIEQPAIHIVGINLHSHLLGIKMSSRLIHNGVETEIARDDNYDFNLQLTRMLKEEVTVYPGDTLIAECTYGTTHKNSVVYGGYGTPEEMCQNFLWYYPKFNLSFCESSPTFKSSVTYAGVQNYTRSRGVFTITAPEHLVNKTYEEVMEAVPWTDEKARDFEEYLLNGTFSTRCRASHHSRVDTTALRRGNLSFPRGTRLPTEDICSLSSTPAPDPAGGTDPVGGTTTLQPLRAAIYVLIASMFTLWR